MSGLAAIPRFLAQHWEQLSSLSCVLVATLVVGYAAKRILVRVLRPWAERGKGPAAPIVINALQGQFMVWVLILGTHLAMQSSDLAPAGDAYGRAHPAGAVDLVCDLHLRAAGRRPDPAITATAAPGALPVTTLTQTLAQLAVVILGILVLLNQLGISITPILTALGVGGLAVALALQDTLSNLFAGFYVAVAGQVRLGDYIKLNSGEEGYVTDIGWRCTTVRASASNMIIIPNNKLGQAIVTNFYLPDKRVAVSIQIGVSYDSDPDLVEAVLLEEAKSAAAELPGMLAEPSPA